MAALIFDAASLPAVVMRIGRMFSPNELSMPLLPSTCVLFGAPICSVQTSVDEDVVTFWSML